jgi:hypothetical protein
MNGLAKYGQWPDMGNGYYHSLSPHKMYLTCGNCQLVCHPQKAERKRRYELLKQGGVIIQNEDGSLKAFSPGEAKEKLEAMDPHRRAMYQ